MATKKDLLEAQKFSRTRLLSAFLGGAPGGKELEPANPLRAVYGSIALTAMVIIAGIFLGFFKPGLPSGWENNRLIVAKDTGARYVSMESVLYPVVNTVSARLLIPPGEFSVVSVNQDVLSGVQIGDTIGIAGGPDSLPTAGDLDGTNWLACSAPERTELWLGGESADSARPDAGRLVTHEDSSYVVADGKSFAVPDKQQAAVLRAVGLSGATPTEVTGEWLSLFEPADPFDPLEIPEAGSALPGTRYPVGTVIHPIGSPEEEMFLLTAEGALSPLSPLAYRLYQLGDGSGDLGEIVDVNPADLADLPSGPSSEGTGWPDQSLTPQDGGADPCAVLDGPMDAQRTALAGEHGKELGPAETDEPVRTHIPEGGGAMVRAGQGGTLTLIDPLGVSYAVPGPISDSVLRFGYEDADVTVVPHQWLDLLPAGPALTVEAAGSSPVQP